MGLFSKDKGLILNILNGIFIIWIVGALVACVSNLSYIVVKDSEYTYDEYKIMYCDMEYDTEDYCSNSYISYNLGRKDDSKTYLRNEIIAVSNVLLVMGALILVNKEKKKNK
jgi:hypothetical protein